MDIIVCIITFPPRKFHFHYVLFNKYNITTHNVDKFEK